MKRLCYWSALVAVVAANSANLWADDAGDARAVVTKAIKAAGGEENLKKFQAATWNEKGIYHGMGQPLPYTGNYVVHWPSKFRMEIEGVFTLIINGDNVWMNGAELPKEQLEEQKESHYAGWVTSLLPLKDVAFKLSPLPESKVGDRPAVGVKVSHAKHRDVNLYFDKDSGLLVKSETRVKSEDMGGKEVSQESHYSDYKDVEGAKTPMKMVIKRDGKNYVEAEVIDLKPVAKVDEKLFAKP